MGGASNPSSWKAIASSSDGTKLIACVDNGYIYTSSDGGITWIERVSSGKREWSGITSSGDGSKLAACVGGIDGGYIYISTDGGVTWNEKIAAGKKNGKPLPHLLMGLN